MSLLVFVLTNSGVEYQQIASGSRHEILIRSGQVQVQVNSEIETRDSRHKGRRDIRQVRRGEKQKKGAISKNTYGSRGIGLIEETREWALLQNAQRCPIIKNIQYVPWSGEYVAG